MNFSGEISLKMSFSDLRGRPKLLKMTKLKFSIFNGQSGIMYT